LKLIVIAVAIVVHWENTVVGWYQLMVVASKHYYTKDDEVYHQYLQHSALLVLGIKKINK
jgi:hypothetical protein